MEVRKVRKELFLKKTMSLALVAAMALTVSPTTTFAATNVVTEVSTYAAENNETYKYVYAGLTWSEYWKSEGVYQTNLTAVRNSIRVALMQ